MPNITRHASFDLEVTRSIELEVTIDRNNQDPEILLTIKRQIEINVEL